AGGSLVLNEIADTRAELLHRLFPAIGVTRYDAAHIHDHLGAAIRPSVVLMNPPFSAVAHVDGRVADAAFRHISSALAPLAQGAAGGGGRGGGQPGRVLSPQKPFGARGFCPLGGAGSGGFSGGGGGGVLCPPRYHDRDPPYRHRSRTSG